MFQSSERGVDRILNLEILSKDMEPSIRSDYSPVTGANSILRTLRDLAVLSYVPSEVYYECVRRRIYAFLTSRYPPRSSEILLHCMMIRTFIYGDGHTNYGRDRYFAGKAWTFLNLAETVHS